MKIVNFYAYTNTESSPEYEASQTVPDDALSVRDILQRYASNQPCNVAVHTDTGVDADTVGWDSLASVDLDTLDMAEIDSLTSFLNSRKAVLQEELNQRRAEERKAYRDNRINSVDSTGSSSTEDNEPPLEVEKD